MHIGKNSPDGFSVQEGKDNAALHHQIAELCFELEDKLWWPPKLKETKAGPPLVEGDAQQRRLVLLAFAERIRHANQDWQLMLHQCLVELLRADLELSEADYFDLAATILPSTDPCGTASHSNAGPAVLKALGRAERRGLLSDRILELVLDYVTKLELETTDAKQIELCNLLLKRAAQNPLNPIEPWAKKAHGQVRALPGPKAEVWIRLLIQCQLATSAKPTEKWRKQALLCLAQVGVDSFHEHLAEWLPLVDKPRKKTPEEAADRNSHDPGFQLLDHHQDILRGLVWLAGMSPAPETTRCLGGLALTTFRKLKGQGPRAPRIANACVWSLAEIGDEQAVEQLALLKIKVKLNNANMVTMV